ncbi:hypothetical protein QWM81_15180 [Streptomyces ficellus]|uniref:Uncharacterized protein n=1 Tax=Streptomyces ficellus TaxID=1977088 RepID=A0ABT7Z794_9ACTN|nr:hypothetical protein [Streptomyces ficellus]MDN3295372.1 hypothetical protein [Streptomyces ficellus]
MNTTVNTARTEADRPARPTASVRSAGTLSEDHRFALLTARTGLEPDLAQRYTADPLSVLAEFGLAAEPVYAGGRYDGGDWGGELVIENLDGPASAAGCYGCYSGLAPLPVHESARAVNG